MSFTFSIFNFQFSIFNCVMALILNIDTSTDVCSVAIARDGYVIALMTRDLIIPFCWVCMSMSC